MYLFGSNKDGNYPTFLFKQMPTCPFIITILYDAQSTLHSHAITINHAKFHFLETKTLFTMEFSLLFHYFIQKLIN